MKKTLAIVGLLLGSSILLYLLITLVSVFLPLGFSSAESRIMGMMLAGLVSCGVVVSSLSQKSPVGTKKFAGLLSVASVLSVIWLVISPPVLFLAFIMGGANTSFAGSTFALLGPALFALFLWFIPAILLYGVIFLWVYIRRSR